MKRILLLLILSVCLLPLWSQETVTPVKPLSARIDALIEHKLPAGSNVATSVFLMMMFQAVKIVEQISGKNQNRCKKQKAAGENQFRK